MSAAAESPYEALRDGPAGSSRHEDPLLLFMEEAEGTEAWAGSEPAGARREWSGAVYEFWGDGTVRDWQLCALSCFCAPFVWGDNLKRALVLGFLRHAVLFLFLRFLGHWILSLIFLECGESPIPEIHDKSRRESQQDIEREARYQACMRGYLSAKYTILLFTILLFFYAGWRRIQIRKRYGLAGSDTGDYLAWLILSPCALCQETRTIHRNRVEGGQWSGPPPALSRAGVLSPPPRMGMPTLHEEDAASPVTPPVTRL